MIIKNIIAGKFSGENVQLVYSFQAFGGKSLTNDRSAKRLLIVTTTLDGLVWQIADDLPK